MFECKSRWDEVHVIWDGTLVLKVNEYAVESPGTDSTHQEYLVQITEGQPKICGQLARKHQNMYCRVVRPRRCSYGGQFLWCTTSAQDRLRRKKNADIGHAKGQTDVSAFSTSVVTD